MTVRIVLAALFGVAAAPLTADERLPTFEDLLRYDVRLRPELVSVHPRVFVTAQGLRTLRERARTSHRQEWQRVLVDLPALKSDPPPPPGPQARRSQNDIAFAIAGVSLAYAVEGKPEYLAAARRWLLAAIDYEPWGYTYNKPNVDLAAGHLLYAIGWAYDLLHSELSPEDRSRVRASLERHARLVYESFAPAPGKRFNFTQNHDFIPTAGLAVAALALMGECPEAPKWAALARAHHHRVGTLLSPDGYYYEGFEYWIFAAPWLVHFLDAWEHATGESLWDREVFRNWKHYVAHSLLPDGQNVFDFGDIWEGPLTRAKSGAEYARAFPGGTLQSNYNVLYRVAARLMDAEAGAVAARLAGFGHSNLEEYWTLLWRDADLPAAPISSLPLRRHFEDSGVVFFRTSWDEDATAFAFKAGPPEGHRVAKLLPKIPEWRLDDGHAHPDAASFILWAKGRYLTGDTGYAGLPSAADHNTITLGRMGQGHSGDHDVWRKMAYEGLDRIRIVSAELAPRAASIVAEASAAYPEEAQLRRLTRSFVFEAPSTFRVTDTIETEAPRSVQWYLHSDRPMELRDAAFHVELDGVVLEGRLALPKGAEVRVEPSLVRSPGPPGSIETGPRNQRGDALVVEVPKAGAPFDLGIVLTVLGGRAPESRPEIPPFTPW
jgi:hypothetical protein